MSAACKGIGNLSSIAGTETHSSLCHMVVRPHGESLTPVKPSDDSLQKVTAPSGLVLPGKSISRKVCVCICEYIAMVHLPGQKAEMAAHREFPQGGERVPSPLLMPRSKVRPCTVSRICCGPRVMQRLFDCHQYCLSRRCTLGVTNTLEESLQ